MRHVWSYGDCLFPGNLLLSRRGPTRVSTLLRKYTFPQHSLTEDSLQSTNISKLKHITVLKYSSVYSYFLLYD